MKKRRTIFLILIFAIFLFFGFFLKIKIGSISLEGIENRTILFVGKGCPHCARVEEFLRREDVRSKIQFEEKEVYHDKSNAKLLLSIAKEKCHLLENETGVPFLWTGSNCIVGDELIINYFKEKIATQL